MNESASGVLSRNALSLNDRDFRLFRDLIFNTSGIDLHDGKKELLRTRLASRIRARGLTSFKDYFDYVSSDKTQNELLGVLDAISTNLTSFFREIGHFEFLRDTAIPALVDSKEKARDLTMRAWSAGCSSGEEPYSIIFTLRESIPDAAAWDLKLLATDISGEMLEKAARGVYHEDKLRTVPKSLMRTYFQKGGKNNPGLFRVRPEIKKSIQFRRFNLMTPQFPFRHAFDFIFCRNVMIYFDKPTRQTLVTKYYNVLAEGGYLLIGHSESLMGIEHRFRYARPTIYRKTG